VRTAKQGSSIISGDEMLKLSIQCRKVIIVVVHVGAVKIYAAAAAGALMKKGKRVSKTG
jgi:hypothetical protein